LNHSGWTGARIFQSDPHISAVLRGKSCLMIDRKKISANILAE
jgi:hypothetical protein